MKSLSEIRWGYIEANTKEWYNFYEELVSDQEDAGSDFDEWLDTHTRTQIARTLENLHQRAYKLCGTKEDVLEYIHGVAKAHREGFTVD